ncbi:MULTISPECIES: prepilin peptidase [unclassified Sphingomonas]|uniref:prepilin peptidase n=2 Tax=Sphingomonas TaxID=13687 RepID=UPI000B25300B|nr:MULTISPECIES: A24 family peptidase [unclassified Sphingomonas]
MTTDAIWWGAGLGGLGLILGSFIATVVLRGVAGESALRGRSRCDGCGATLGPVELVPVLSFVVQRGRCRRCDGAIDPSHLWIELLAGAIGLVAGLAAPGWAGVAGAVFGWLLLMLAAFDLAAFWLPNWGNALLAVAGLASGVAGLDPRLTDRLIGGAAGFALLWSVAAVYQRLRGRVGLGGGDPKLFGAIGLWLGWRALPMVLLAACLLGLAVALVMRLRGREVTGATRLPLGTLLAVAGFGVWVMG